MSSMVQLSESSKAGSARGPQGPAALLAGLLRELLERGAVAAVLAPKPTPAGTTVTQVLIADPEQLDGIDPLAPVQMVNAAHILRELAREPLEQKIAAVLRPCEVRATIELAKLKQVSLDSVVLISHDCPGVHDLNVYLDAVAGSGAEAVRERRLAELLGEGEAGGGKKSAGGAALRNACRQCMHFTGDSADLSLAWIGAGESGALLEVHTDKGRELLGRGAEAPAPAGRAESLERIRAQRLAAQGEEPEELLTVLERCIRCYNCREVCPICYCKECLMKPEKMGYSPERYLRRAQKKGLIKMPVDTVLYHLTRMNHMASSCVACGLCEQACPMDIPLGSIFARVGRNVQALFDYVPGRSLEEELPVTTFKEDELPGVEDAKR